MSLLARRIASSALLALTACATAKYEPINPKSGFGYREQKLPSGSYDLFVVTPDAPHTRAFWDRRASELCGGQAYRKSIFRADRPTVLYQHYGGMPGNFELEGYVTCAQPAAPTPQPGPTPPPAPMSAKKVQ